MAISQAILDLENRYVGATGEATLGLALKLAADAWISGERDRELSLHVLLLAWYCNLEPPHLTGYAESFFPSGELAQLFNEVYRSLEPGILDDAECLYVVGLMAMLTPYLLGDDEATWQARSARFEMRYRSLAPSGLPAAQFDGRGAYGDYFSGQIVVRGGYGHPAGA